MNEQMPHEPAPAAAAEGEGQSQNPMTEMISGLGTGLMKLTELSADSMPPEAQDHLKKALEEYMAFAQMAAGGAPAGGGAMGNSPADVQGRAGAVPAEGPMRKGAVPA